MLYALDLYPYSKNLFIYLYEGGGPISTVPTNLGGCYEYGG